MPKLSAGLVLVFGLCLAMTAVAMQLLGGVDIGALQQRIHAAGPWAPLVYVLVYVVSTLLILPSTVLNLAGGALFGPWFGMLWTTVGAVLAAVVAFAFTRSVGRRAVERRLAGRWQQMDQEVRRGGLFYMFAIRLVPIMPYGLVNFAAGLTSVSSRDYLLGTTLGIVPGILPFVLMGSSGVRALRTGDVWPLLGALGLTGALVAFTTWYRRRLPG